MAKLRMEHASRLGQNVKVCTLTLMGCPKWKIYFDLSSWHGLNHSYTQEDSLFLFSPLVGDYQLLDDGECPTTTEISQTLVLPSLWGEHSLWWPLLMTAIMQHQWQLMTAIMWLSMTAFDPMTAYSHNMAPYNQQMTNPNCLHPRVIHTTYQGHQTKLIFIRIIF